MIRKLLLGAALIAMTSSAFAQTPAGNGGGLFGKHGFTDVGFGKTRPGASGPQGGNEGGSSRGSAGHAAASDHDGPPDNVESDEPTAGFEPPDFQEDLPDDDNGDIDIPDIDPSNPEGDSGFSVNPL